jgi:hypothetical protein
MYYETDQEIRVLREDMKPANVAKIFSKYYISNTYHLGTEHGFLPHLYL